MHGQYVISTGRRLVSGENTLLWLSKGDLKAQIESEIVAAQNQTLQKKKESFANKVLQTQTDNKRRICQQF
jgi:hypothetical protein